MIVHVVGSDGKYRRASLMGELLPLEPGEHWHAAGGEYCRCAITPPADESSVLEDAMKVVGERAKTHGEDTLACFGAIADQWTAYIRSAKGSAPQISAFDVAQMMVLFKVARSISGDPLHKDHYIDQAGYSELAWRLVKGQRS